MTLCNLELHPSLSSGFTGVDDGHRELFALYNRIVSSCTEDSSAAIFCQRTRTFLLYAKWHFCEEEAIMLRCHYPKHMEHKSDHQQLIQDATDFLDSFGEALGPKDAPAIAMYFKHWLTRHIVEKDVALASFVRAGSRALEVGSRTQPKEVLVANPDSREANADLDVSRDLVDGCMQLNQTCRSMVEFWMAHLRNDEAVPDQEYESVILDTAMTTCGRRTPAEAYAALRYLTNVLQEKTEPDAIGSTTQRVLTRALGWIIASKHSHSIADVQARISFLEDAAGSDFPRDAVEACAKALRHDVTRMCRGSV